MAGRHVLRRTPRARLASAGRAVRAAAADSPETAIVVVALLALALAVVLEAVL